MANLFLNYLEACVIYPTVLILVCFVKEISMYLIIGGFLRPAGLYLADGHITFLKHEKFLNSKICMVSSVLDK